LARICLSTVEVRRKEEVEEPLSMDESAEKSRQQVREDHQSHKAGYQYEYLYDYLHAFIVEGGRDRFLALPLPFALNPVIAVG
jgi:hypothetical protein